MVGAVEMLRTESASAASPLQKKPSNLAERISRKAAGEMGALGIRLVPETAFQPRWRVRSRKERWPHTIAQPTAGEPDSRSGVARALPMAREYRDVFWRRPQQFWFEGYETLKMESIAAWTSTLGVALLHWTETGVVGAIVIHPKTSPTGNVCPNRQMLSKS